MGADPHRYSGMPSLLRRDAVEAGCWGLVEGVARSLRNGALIEAEIATKDDGPFVCPACHSDAVVKKCAEKRDHFAHHAPLTPVLGRGESALHLDCKREICDALAARFPDGKWEVEREIPATPRLGISRVVPDISGRVGEQRLAIEIQVSALTIPKVLRRISVYTRRAIPMLWVIPLTENVAPGFLFRPRLYERYLHSLYFDRAYYWLRGMGSRVIPIHFSRASRYIDTTEWYDVDAGEERFAGGYEKPYKVIRTALPAPPIDVVEAFKRHERGAFTPDNERKAVPASLLWLDTLPRWWSSAEERMSVRRVQGKSTEHEAMAPGAVPQAG